MSSSALKNDTTTTPLGDTSVQNVFAQPARSAFPRRRSLRKILRTTRDVSASNKENGLRFHSSATPVSPPIKTLPAVPFPGAALGLVSTDGSAASSTESRPISSASTSSVLADETRSHALELDGVRAELRSAMEKAAVWEAEATQARAEREAALADAQNARDVAVVLERRSNQLEQDAVRRARLVEGRETHIHQLECELEELRAKVEEARTAVGEVETAMGMEIELREGKNGTWVGKGLRAVGCAAVGAVAAGIAKRS